MKLTHIACSFVILVISCNTLKTDYYFPKGYTGDVAIVYGCEGGEQLTIKNGRRQIVIPDSGICLLKTDFKEGQLDERFYVKDEKDSFREVQRYAFQKDTCCDKRYIFFERVVEFVGKDRSNKSFASKINLFYFGKSLKLDTNRNYFENHVQKLLANKAYP